ncbi:hypothetical protein [Gloeobacter kilaueensis]|uniref:Uncharacterized protein n=1 Tax=Gloeobacter kilaueensis (strain ATCC BAA-2537 / CCAP 1431/1 / ULC 316 / JS1) TaxID=1183438 RepID=U5QIL4_GLOK1|nr:hypothetical protein [Gloeobacter kilaueensis]AGY57505.1 hypothetical protein GKIL_1259 [Gloeobacter kilaueensis JS1]
MSDKPFSIAEFTARVEQVARRVDPVLRVSQAGDTVVLVSYPGLGSHVWVAAADDGEKFAVLKTRNDAPRPAHMGSISPVGEGFLAEILRNYVAEVGHPRV